MQSIACNKCRNHQQYLSRSDVLLQLQSLGYWDDKAHLDLLLRKGIVAFNDIGDDRSGHECSRLHKLTNYLPIRLGLLAAECLKDSHMPFWIAHLPRQCDTLNNECRQRTAGLHYGSSSHQEELILAIASGLILMSRCELERSCRRLSTAAAMAVPATCQYNHSRLGQVSVLSIQAPISDGSWLFDFTEHHGHCQNVPNLL